MWLALAVPWLANSAIIVVDDCNFRHVRQANRDWLVTHPEFTLLFEAYTPAHPNNMTTAELATARAGWWNGVNIIVRDPQRVLARHLPPTDRDRSLFENEHIVHSSKHASLAPEVVTATSALLNVQLVEAAKRLFQAVVKLRRVSNTPPGEFTSFNTFSSDLPARRVNSTLDN